MDTPTKTYIKDSDTVNSVAMAAQKNTATSIDVMTQRLQLFRQQEQAVQAYYAAYHTSNLSGVDNQDPQCYLTQRQGKYIETQKLLMAYRLNGRDVAGVEQLQVLFNHLPVVDDLLLDVVRYMPAQRPIGWQLVSLGQNLLNLPTTSPLRQIGEGRAIEQSLAATILQFFGVGCYSLDKGYFIGHILGYLFCCYYFANLNINYAVTPLKESIAPHYPYQSLGVPQLVRLLQQTDEALKAKVYQLAIYAAQISEYAVDKRIEKMLIAEVNSFNKQNLRDELASYVLYGENEKSALFQPIKPLK